MGPRADLPHPPQEPIGLLVEDAGDDAILDVKYGYALEDVLNVGARDCGDFAGSGQTQNLTGRRRVQARPPNSLATQEWPQRAHNHRAVRLSKASLGWRFRWPHDGQRPGQRGSAGTSFRLTLLGSAPDT